MKKSFVLLFAFVAAVFTSCGDDDSNQAATGPTTGVSFANPSMNVTDPATQVQIVFSGAVAQAGTVTVSAELTNVVYGTDFTTAPATTNNTIVVPFDAGATGAEFTFNKLIPNVSDVKNVKFTITNTTFAATISGNVTIQVNLNDTAVSGGQQEPATGGAGAPNAIFADLSSGTNVSAVRTSWDLGFYTGTEFRVGLNNSVKMSAKQLTTTNIDETVASDDTMLINQGSGALSQIDEPQGLAEGLVINVSANDADNKVYLVNLGNGPAATPPALGSDGSANGAHRGWKKVRVLRDGTGYKLQYADIASTTHQEVSIAKNAAYNFTFFSLLNNAVTQVEPQKNYWDIAFTPFVNSFSMGSGPVPYYFADFIVTNTKGGARSYQVMTTEFAYDAFTLANVDQTKFTNDQRNIGSNWRGTSAMGPGGVPVSQFVLRTDRFYIVKDPAGNTYKVKMTGGAAENNERGFPKFQYTLLQ